VLIEGPSKARAENLTGRSERNEIVHVAHAADLGLVGQLVDVEIVQALKHSLLGKLCAQARERIRGSGEPRPKRTLPIVTGGTL